MKTEISLFTSDKHALTGMAKMEMVLSEILGRRKASQLDYLFII